MTRQMMAAGMEARMESIMGAPEDRREMSRGPLRLRGMPRKIDGLSSRDDGEQEKKDQAPNHNPEYTPPETGHRSALLSFRRSSISEGEPDRQVGPDHKG